MWIYGCVCLLCWLREQSLGHAISEKHADLSLYFIYSDSFICSLKALHLLFFNCCRLPSPAPEGSAREEETWRADRQRVQSLAPACRGKKGMRRKQRWD